MAARSGSTVLDDVVAECVGSAADVFGVFYFDYLMDYARQLAESDVFTAEENVATLDQRGVARSLLLSVTELLSRIGIRTLITAFRDGSDVGSPVPMDYRGFCEWVGNDSGRGQLLAQLPELDRLLRLAVDRHVAHAKRVLVAAWQDRQLLNERFGARGRVTSLVPGLGDSHRGGATVCFLHWDNGATVVYKPRREAGYELLTALREVLDRDGSFFGPLCPDSAVFATHTWQEHVAHTDVDGDAGTARYFQRFGRVSALLSMLGAVDLHNENVIATADGPVVVDTETVISPPLTVDAGQVDGLARDIEGSPLNTLLFSTRLAGGLDSDLSAIGCLRQDESQKLLTFKVVDAGTDEIRFDRVPVVLRPGASMATIAGEPVDPRLWVDAVTAGFAAARDLLRHHRRAVEGVLSRSDNWAARHILRPTYVYGRFLEASTHPAYLASTGDRETLLGKLPPRLRGVRGEAAGAVNRAEIRALRQLDVPFFEVGCDSHHLSSNGDAEVVNAVSTTPKEATLARINSFFDRPPGRDLTYIRYSLASSVDDVWEPAENGLPPGSSRLSLGDPADWHASLRELVVTGGDSPTWLMPQLEGTKLHLGPVNTLLHEGGGLLLYLADAEAAGAVPSLGVDLGDVYAGAVPDELPETAAPASVSPFTGILSVLVTWSELRRRGLAAGVPRPGLNLSTGRQVDVQDISAHDLDYLNGFGGYLIYLAEYALEHDRVRREGIDHQLLLAQLLKVDGPPDRSAGQLGLAHGRFGRIAAMSAGLQIAQGATGDLRDHLERFTSAYLRHRWTDEALQDALQGSGWCKGYAGVAYALTKSMRALGYSTGDIRQGVTPEVERVIGGQVGNDISFCHGVGGRLAMLCWLADRLDWPELRNEAKTLSDRFIERFGDGGWYCGVGSTAELPSFLFGLSGWYFAQLMLVNDAVELPLCLGGR